MSRNLNKKIAEIFTNIADAIESGSFAERKRIGLTILGSEHPISELVRGAELASEKYSDLEIVLIGEGAETDLEMLPAKDLDECHKVMEKALAEGVIHGCVTLHYNFPLGVSTVGRLITPGRGKEMILATTTGTSDTERVAGMVKNAIYGVAVAKSLGNKNPKIGILNIDGANPTGRKLKELKENGYEIDFAESARRDGGITMRGNDLLVGTPDVMVCDTLTGNLLMKMFSSFTTGGSYEASGYGYGPGIGENFDSVISIISRASGAPVICEALRYNADAVSGKVFDILKKEFDSARKAGLDEILKPAVKEAVTKEVVCPPKKVVSEQIPGIDILEIEEAKEELWEEKIYAETGMGCTGPIIIVAKEDLESAKKVLAAAKYISA
ncbi:MAG: glycine reductase [Candidatus Cloacimonadota bacterium]|nr:MAG: glycine reductase [Candidatus Cloacimonadota bacterium]